MGIDRIKGHHLWAHFNEIKDQNLRRSPESIRRWNQCVIECQSIARQHLLPNGKQVRRFQCHPTHSLPMLFSRLNLKTSLNWTKRVVHPPFIHKVSVHF